MVISRMWRAKTRRYIRISALWALPVLMACSEVRPYRLEPGELFPDGKPLGQPYTHKRPEIRMVRVSSVCEADSFYMTLRDKHPKCETSYTHDTPAGTYEVAIIRIMDSAVIAQGIKEIHFVETVKPKRK